MLTKHLWMLLLCFIPAVCVSAQPPTDSVRKEKNRHFIFGWSTGGLFIQKKPGQLAIGFPYFSSNLPSTGQFRGTLDNPFSQDLLLQDFFYTEFFSRHHSIDFHIGLMTNDDHRNSTYSDAEYIAGGYAHAFYVGKQLMVKTGADLIFYQFSRGLGAIDNRNADVYALGYDSGATFTISTTNRGVTTTRTYTTDRLAVDFVQNVLAFAPSIRLTSPPSHPIYWAVQVAWFLPLIDKGGLNLTQLDSAGSRNSFQNRFGLIGLDEPGITATFNGRPTNHSPYSLGGVYLGGTVGLCVGR